MLHLFLIMIQVTHFSCKKIEDYEIWCVFFWYQKSQNISQGGNIGPGSFQNHTWIQQWFHSCFLPIDIYHQETHTVQTLSCEASVSASRSPPNKKICKKKCCKQAKVKVHYLEALFYPRSWVSMDFIQFGIDINLDPRGLCCIQDWYDDAHRHRQKRKVWKKNKKGTFWHIDAISSLQRGSKTIKTRKIEMLLLPRVHERTSPFNAVQT